MIIYNFENTGFILCVVKRLQVCVTLRKKAGPDDQHMRVIGLHRKRPAYPSQSTMFQNESKDSSALPAYAVNLHACAGTRLASKMTFLFWLLLNRSDFQTRQKARIADLLRRVEII